MLEFPTKVCKGNRS